MILLHIGISGVVCYEIMKHGNTVNCVRCIEVFPFKMNVTCFIKERNIIVLVVAMYVNK